MRFLLRLQLLTDTVRYNLAPVDFRSRYGQLPPERLERRIGHRLIVFRYCRLVVVLALLDQSYDLLRRVGLVRDRHRLAAVLRRHELHVAVLVVVHLQLERTLQLGRAAPGRGERDRPHGAPPAVPEVFRLKLVVLDADVERDLPVHRSAEHRAGPVAVVVGGVCERLDVQHRAPLLGRVVAVVVLQIGRFLAQVVELEALLGARIEETATTCHRGKGRAGGRGGVGR